MPDDALAGWLGKEFTVESSTLNDHMPVGGKLTFVFDSEDNVVRICTRNSVTTADSVAHGLRQSLRRDDGVHARHALLHAR